jgi:hypothetical protein
MSEKRRDQAGEAIRHHSDRPYDRYRSYKTPTEEAGWVDEGGGSGRAGEYIGIYAAGDRAGGGVYLTKRRKAQCVTVH